MGNARVTDTAADIDDTAACPGSAQLSEERVTWLSRPDPDPGPVPGSRMGTTSRRGSSLLTGTRWREGGRAMRPDIRDLGPRSGNPLDYLRSAT
jgi:hypothetical protein